MTLSDLNQCKKKNSAAQKLLYLTYVDRLFNVSVRYTKDNHEAKDILQDSFLKIFDKIDGFDDDLVGLEKWMVRIVINTALQHYRAEKKFFYGDSGFMHITDKLEPIILQSLCYEDFKKYIDSLPDELRLTFNLRYVEGYRHKEIAALLGIKESSSRTRLTRAKKILRQLLIDAKMIEYAP